MKYLFFLLVILSLGCSGKTEPPVVYSYFPLESFVVKGITIGDTHSNILKKLGSPRKEIIGTSDSPEEKPRTLYYTGIEIYISENEAVNILVTNPEIRFQGLAIGSTKEKAINIFGKGKEQSSGNETKIRYIVNKSDGSITDSQFVIHIENDRIKMFELWYDYT